MSLTNSVYKANITSNLENQVTKEYIGVSETTFKKTLRKSQEIIQPR